MGLSLKNGRFTVITLFLVGPCFGWKLPSISFLEAFARHMKCEGMVIYLPNNIVIDKRITEITRHFSKLGMPVGITYEMKIYYERPSLLRSNKVMHVTVAEAAENANMKKFIKDNFDKRDHTHKDIWLMGVEIPLF